MFMAILYQTPKFKSTNIFLAMKISKFNSHQCFQQHNIKLILWINSEELEPQIQYLVHPLSLLVGMWGDHSAGIGECAKQTSAQKSNN